MYVAAAFQAMSSLVTDPWSHDGMRHASVRKMEETKILLLSMDGNSEFLEAV
jgi:hypothetical protein